MHSVVLISGISGSGKSLALRTLEDLGYTCVDNLPMRYLADFIANAARDHGDRVAVTVDVRSAGDLESIPEVIHALRQSGFTPRALFLDASTETLVQRYSESRRAHPLTSRLRNADGKAPLLTESIAKEREMLGPMREISHVLDTTNVKPDQLRQWISDLLSVNKPPTLLTFESFAFKIGIPRDADLMFDVRCLPNPHYETALRPLTGRDPEVASWLAQHDSVRDMIQDITQFIEKWLPRYTDNTRSYLTVAIGCTGGQHRSVYIVEQLARHFGDNASLLIRHRGLAAKGMA